LPFCFSCLTKFEAEVFF